MRFRQYLSTILSSLLMFVTFGTFTAKAKNVNNELNVPVATVEASADTQLNALKQRIRADYRANIANYLSENQAKGSGGKVNC
jgi:hypothetical protein